MNRAKALTIADRIMTRIETDKAIHKDAIADEIVAGDALNEQTMPPALAIGTARVAGDKLLVWDGKKWWEPPSCVTSGTVSEPEQEIVDVISHDGEKWVHRDGTPFDMDADKTKLNRLTVDGPEVMRTTTVGRDIVFGAASTVIDLDDKDTA